MLDLRESADNIAEYEKRCRDEFKLTMKKLVYKLEPEEMVEIAFQFELDLQHSIEQLKSEIAIT